MLQSISISDYKHSPQSIFNSLQSQGVIKSVNLNSGIKSSAIKSSASKRLHSECNSDMQLSLSSEHSKQRSFSQQSNRPTITRNIINNQSIIDTVNKKIPSETKETKFVSINNEYVSEFNIKKEKESLINLQNKVTILIDENQKLILINEQLMQELEKTKILQESNNQTVLLQSLQRETQSLQQTILQYKKVNNQQSQQILELQQILNEREELNIEKKSINESNQIRLLKEQFTQLASKYLLKCFELERHLQNEWEDKIKILLKENENLNLIIQQRLNEQIQLQQQYKQQNDIILKLEQEIIYFQKQLQEQNIIMTKKNQDQITFITDINKQYEIKNEENKKLNDLLQQQENKWRSRCIEFEKEMKLSYSNKLNNQIKLINDDYQRQILNYSQTIAVLQGQMDILHKQNEQLHRVNQKNSNLKEWQHEKQLYYEIIQELQQKVAELTGQLAKILQQNYASDYSSLGIQEQLNRIEDFQKLNQKNFQRCHQIISQRQYF